MTLRSSLLVFGLGSGFAGAAFLLILFTVPPETAGAAGEAFFFGSLFVALTGVLTVLGVLGRVRRSTLLPALHIGPSFRHGFLLSAAAVGMLLLQRFRFLRWWTILIVVLILVVLDVALSRRDPREHAEQGV